MFGHNWPRIYIGYDEAQRGPWHALCHSIMEKSSLPVQFIPLYYKTVPGYGRAVKEGYTQFSYLRYYIPFLSSYDGWAIYMDSDQFSRADIAELWNKRQNQFDIMCAKSDLNQKTARGPQMAQYARANWHSVSLWNCSALKCLSVDVVNKASKEWLRDMQWTTDERIGGIGMEWNHLVQVYDENPTANHVHFTVGGPWAEAFKGVEYSKEWFDLHKRMCGAERQ